MKKLCSLTVLIFCLMNCSLFSQNKDLYKKVEKLKNKGRDSLIEYALDHFDENIRKDSYTISVRANKSSVIVSFHSPIVFLPMKSVYHHYFGCDLVEGTTWSGIISNPEGFGADRDEIPNYSRTDEMQEHINFVFDALKQSEEIGTISPEDFTIDDLMVIREYKRYYDITMLSPYQESFYKVDKKTGEIFDAGHAHLMRDPDGEDEDPFEEIE